MPFHCNYMSDLAPFLRHPVSSNGVTLKSGLEVTQGHFKMVPFESLGTVSYLHCIVTMAVFYFMSEIKRFFFRKSRFFPRDSMHSADYAVARCPTVRPSVYLSVTPRYSIERAKHVIKLFHHRVATPFYTVSQKNCIFVLSEIGQISSNFNKFW